MNESDTIKIIIPGEPKFQQRHRSAMRLRKGVKAVQAKNKETGQVVKLYRKEDFFIHNYDPSYKDKVKIVKWLRLLAPERMFRVPIRVDRFYYFSYLQGHYGTGRNADKVRASAPVWKATRPDIDNFDKFLFDILMGIFYHDDGQICAGVQIKRYDAVPRTEVFITPLNSDIEAEELENELYIQTNRPGDQAENKKTAELAFSGSLKTNA